ncbi:MAG: aminotransferase class I/II-fold pyridoxal phosphate-dependent enzyme [Oscillospiraceae bacterium]|nr:aminotransferase class I/II-fold pyridoxal phosphate-dependent enzyme [Oscillospiraceae bacterium]
MRLPMNEAVTGLELSGIRRFTALARQTPGCVLLTLGEPEFQTPPSIKAEAMASLDKNETHYPPNNGEGYLLSALSQEAAAQNLSYSPEEIVVTCGATEALFSTLTALLNPGDEVIVPTPAFGLYESIIRLARGVFVPLDTREDRFQITRAALERAASPRTKAIILTSPNNPTGCVYTPETLDQVAALARRTGLYAVCDDVYRQLVYTEAFPRFAVRHPELREQIIVIDSFSKPYAMTGWRLGWLMADRPVKEQIQKVHQYAVVSVTSFTQRACVAALKSDAAPMRESYRRRRDLVCRRLKDMGLETVRPEGAFYVFPSIARYGMSSEEFCTQLIQKGGLGLVPGACFGAEGFVRLSYCYSEEELKEGLDRLERFLSTI